MSTLKTNNLQLLDQSRTIAISKLAEMNGGFSFRNKIVDGRFDFWYEGTSSSSNVYGSDTMYVNYSVGSTKVHSQQTLVAGVDLPAIDCPSAKYFSRTVVTSVAGAANYVCKIQNIEGVSTLAGKQAVVSFYAKADSVKNIAISLQQGFGTGGSVMVSAISAQLVGLSTTWKRYSIPVTLPSISGKTIAGGNDSLQLLFWFDAGSSFSVQSSGLGQQSGTFDIACIQLEEGSVATPFEELPIEISQQRVERYFEQQSLVGMTFGGFRASTTTMNTGGLPFSVKKRTTPVLTVKNIGFNATFVDSGIGSGILTAITLAETSADVVSLTVTGSAVTITQGTKYVYWGFLASPTILNFDARL